MVLSTASVPSPPLGAGLGVGLPRQGVQVMFQHRWQEVGSRRCDVASE